MLTNYWKCQNRSVQTFGFVYHDTNGLNHGPVWKIQSFLLKGICTVILWQDYYGKGNLRKSYWNMVGRKFQIGNVSLCIVRKDYSYLCMWMTKQLAGKKQNLDPMWKVLSEEVDLGEPTSFLIMYTWAALEDNAKQAKILWTITEPCSNREFPRVE